MELSELEQEAERLARPCAYLRPAGDTYAAVWTGSPGSDFELVFSSTSLPAPGWNQQGTFRLASDGTDVSIAFAEGARLPAEPKGVKLYAAPARSLPPVDALFALGSDRVQRWLRSLDWPPGEPYNSNFPDRDAVEVYERGYMEQLPFYSGGAHAVLGGWHLPWPDGDWLELVPSRLLVWTFEGGEPWFEAWASGEALRVLRRIT
jgi:hypothetical protein